MSKRPLEVKARNRQAAVREGTDVVPAPTATNAQATFRYAYASISVEGGKARVTARRAQWTDGKLESESFEGDVDRTVFDRAIEEAQRQFVAHSALLWQSFASFLPRKR
jgi:hypothetical protein